MRLFIAIQLSEAVRDAIGRAQDALYEKGSGVDIPPGKTFI